MYGNYRICGYSAGELLKDMSEGLSARWESDENENTMTRTELVEYRRKLVNEEYLRLNKYSEQSFENEKFDMLAHAYIDALETQLQALDYYDEMEGLYDIEWGSGYSVRALIIPTFVDSYGLVADEELVSEFRNGNTATITEQTNMDNTSDKGSETSIELFNAEGIKVTMTGMDEPNATMTRFRLNIQNLNHHDIVVNTSDYQLVANGVMVNSPLFVEVQSGKTANATMDFYQMDLDTAGIDKIRELSFAVDILDQSSFMTLYKGDEKFLVINDKNEVSERAVYTDKKNIQKVQTLLNAAGYNCGAADGVPGKQTNSALLQFEKDHGIAETTDITPELIEILESTIG